MYSSDCCERQAFAYKPPFLSVPLFYFFFNAAATTEFYTLSLHDALPIYSSTTPRRPIPTQRWPHSRACGTGSSSREGNAAWRSEEHTSELQSHSDLVCRLLLEKKKRL